MQMGALATRRNSGESSIMTLAVLGDIHSNLDALDAVLGDIARRGIKRIVNLGDSLSGPFDAAGTADRLMPLDLPTVQGNHDRQLIDRAHDKMGAWESWAIGDLAAAHLDWVRAMPRTLTLDEVFLCHGTPQSDEENWLDKRGKNQRSVARDLNEVEALAGRTYHPVMLCGHTHIPRVVRIGEGTLVVNPGSVGCPAYLDTRMSPHFVHQTGAPDARYAIVEKREGQWAADLIAVPYDASRMADLARAKGAESWARAVTTGWYA